MVNSSKKLNKKIPPSIAVVSPGLLPIPPVKGGSVETVIQKMAEVTSEKFKVDIYGRTHSELPAEQSAGNLNYYRFPAKDYSGYFKLARDQINGRNYSIIQVENRPLFIPRTKAANPRSKFICSLHSLIHIEDHLIKPSLTGEIFNMCDKVLVYSKFMSRQLAARFPKSADKFEFIHLATQPDRFRPQWDPKMSKRVAALKQKLAIPSGHKVVLFAGRVIPKKGVHVLLEAMEKVVKEFPDCCLVVVGSGWFGSKRPSPYIKQLRQQSGKLGGHIRFTNYISPQALPLHFAMADVFICPSQWDEPFGLVNVEAMASGVPVVASARGGIPEIVSDGIDGFLVSKESDPDSFVKPILKLLREPETARRLGVNGRKKVKEYFNWQRAGLQLTSLYEEIAMRPLKHSL